MTCGGWNSMLITNIIFLMIFLGSSLWIGISLLLVGFISFIIFTDFPAGIILSSVGWNQTNSIAMLAVPLFVLMGEILCRSKISQNLFNGLTPWVEWIPGGLMHVNIFACAFFAAVSGSSAATTATVGKITLPELRTRGYSEELSIGSLGGAGTLGFLIPPSIVMIIYGMVADVSIGKLFIAGFIPGIMIALMFVLYITVRSTLNPKLVGKIIKKYTWKERIFAIPSILPVIILISFVLGSIYVGWATPTESAAIGVVGSIFFAFLSKSFTWKIFIESMNGALKTTGMIILILWGAAYFSTALGYLGIPISLSNYVIGLGFSRYFLIFALSLLYIGLGCLVDGLSMIVMTVPIVLPLVKSSGFDPLWFGIYLVVMIQLAQITPPVGFNLFIIKGMTDHDLIWIAKAALPFFIVLCVATFIIVAFPNLVMYFPNLMVR